MQPGVSELLASMGAPAATLGGGGWKNVSSVACLLRGGPRGTAWGLAGGGDGWVCWTPTVAHALMDGCVPGWKHCGAEGMRHQWVSGAESTCKHKAAAARRGGETHWHAASRKLERNHHRHMIRTLFRHM